MPLSLLCPHCRQSLALPDELAGQVVQCGACGGPIQAPAAAPAARGAGTASAPAARRAATENKTRTASAAAPPVRTAPPGQTAPAHETARLQDTASVPTPEAVPAVHVQGAPASAGAAAVSKPAPRSAPAKKPFPWLIASVVSPIALGLIGLAVIFASRGPEPTERARLALHDAVRQHPDWKLVNTYIIRHHQRCVKLAGGKQRFNESTYRAKMVGLINGELQRMGKPPVALR